MPPVPPSEEQASKVKRYSIGIDGKESEAMVAVILILETDALSGAIEKVIGLGVGGLVSIS